MMNFSRRDRPAETPIPRTPASGAAARASTSRRERAPREPRPTPCSRCRPILATRDRPPGQPGAPRADSAHMSHARADSAHSEPPAQMRARRRASPGRAQRRACGAGSRIRAAEAPGSRLLVGAQHQAQRRGNLRLRPARGRGPGRGDRAQQGDGDREARNAAREPSSRRRGNPRRFHAASSPRARASSCTDRPGVGNDPLRPADRRRRRHDHRRREGARTAEPPAAPAPPPRRGRIRGAGPRTHAGFDTSQFALNVTRRTFLSYSASVASVISLPSAANTRPPFRRHALRSYWQGPISGCLRQSASTFSEYSMAVFTGAAAGPRRTHRSRRAERQSAGAVAWRQVPLGAARLAAGRVPAAGVA